VARGGQHRIPGAGAYALVRIILHNCAVAAFLLLAAGCADQQQPAGGNASVARCNECHGYPGSSLCLATTVADSQGVAHTNCGACHRYTTRPDSMVVAGDTLYFDNMMVDGRDTIPRTGPFHANGAFDLHFAQCNLCHASPPATGQHAWHVTQQGKACIECHLSSIRHDTLTDTVNGRIFLARTVDGFGGVQIPYADRPGHINSRVDVVMRKREEKAGQSGNDSMFVWRPLEQTCSNVSCHNPTHSALSSWK
jgi:hypothetical protein